jgi:glucose/arabinose dehydrogenase
LIRWIIIILVLIVVGLWAVAPPINVPARGFLADLLPGLVDRPTVDLAVAERRLSVAPGYSMSLFAKDLPGARILRVTPGGNLLVATSFSGEIWWLAADADGDGRADDRRVVLSGLNRPNGLDIKDGFLYVAEEHQVGRVPFVEEQAAGDYETVIGGLPTGGNHWRKTIRFGPDGLLYMTIGSSCNVCIEEDQRRASMRRYRPDGEFVDVVATGLRNSAGFDWSPRDGQLYATDNGRDLLGDDFPPCELNRITDGGFYGWPVANGAKVPDPDLGEGREAEIAASIAPVFDFRPHNAPLGILFLRGPGHPEAYRDAAIVALHGSWNRSEKDGYKVVSLHWDAEGNIVAEDFITGFLVDEDVSGRPAELAEDAAGRVYVADDYAGAVYRVVASSSGSGSVLVAQKETDQADAREAFNGDWGAAVASGKTYYDGAQCTTCHLLGEPSADGKIGLEDLAGRFSVAGLAKYLAAPVQPMPPVEADLAVRESLAVFLIESAQSDTAQGTLVN